MIKKMKLLTPFILAVFLMLIAQFDCMAGQTKDFAVIKGTWKRNIGRADAINLYKIVDGRQKEVASCKLQDDGSFALALPISQEGFYTYGNGISKYLNKYVCYLKPGDVLNVAVNDTSYTLVGENTPENKSIEKWHNFIFPMEKKAYYNVEMRAFSTYVDFFPLLQQKDAERHSLNFGKSNNPVFDKAFETYRENDFLCVSVSYNHFPRTAHPEAEDMIDFYKNLDIKVLTSTTNLLQHPFGANLLWHLVSDVKKAQGLDEKENFFTLFKNDTLIGELTVGQLRFKKSYADFIDYEKKVGKFVLSDDQKSRWENAKIGFAKNTKEGQPAIDFSYPDISGDTISLSDLKGKLVVIDVWATWCGPCKEQIPFLKKLEEEYRGKAIEFLSVSVDVAKDHQKWIDFVKTEELKGIQLFADGWESDIVKYYNITGIPRFIVVDKDGNLVSLKAPRPSHDDFKKLIDSELSK